MVENKCSRAKEAAEKGRFANEMPERHTSGAKALAGSIDFMPGINPRPTTRRSFSAAYKARIDYIGLMSG
jgi:hypothetical protein